ncbi:gas vesicle protein GvpM [Natronosalvus rutilus]|uniref:Gas vesicle protein n=1 Tax=Natronosalvus rutilus TaxID=2953753 RepID=A0A9E7SUI6_9EURY|nr:gas vesicle protein [Natronosalvus rutilus]UTF53515.1 gas vesicle protein [Natronosalvus rutilus]
MKPDRDDDALVDVLDVLLRDGAVVRADVIVSVAEIPLVGIKLSAAIAGMETMTDYGLFEDWDTTRRTRAVERRQYGHRRGNDDREDADEERDFQDHPTMRPQGEPRRWTPAPEDERERERPQPSTVSEE